MKKDQSIQLIKREYKSQKEKNMIIFVDSNMKKDWYLSQDKMFKTIVFRR